MNRTPREKDIIRIGTKRAEYLVTESGVTPERFTRWFRGVPTSAADVVTGGISGSKESLYLLNSDPSLQKAKVVNLDEIVLVGTAKFEKTTTVTYTIKKVKDV